MVRKDFKKNKIDLITKFTPIGVVDDFLDPKEDQNSKFSMLGKVRNMSVNSARDKVDKLRKHKGNLISASNNHMDEEHLDNVFINSSKGHETYTLSVYNRAEKFTRPMTAPT